MELHRMARQQASRFKGCQVFIGGEQAVQARQLLALAPVEHPGGQLLAPGLVARQQAASRHRGEWYGAQRLGVVGQAVLGIGIGPGPVEHVLTVRVGLEVQHGGSMKSGLMLQQKKLRRPASLWRGAAAGVQGVQIGMAHERGGLALLEQQGIPVARVDVGG